MLHISLHFSLSVGRHGATSSEVLEAASCLGIEMSGLGHEEASASPNKDELSEIARSQDEQKRMQDKQREKERRRSLERKKELERENERKIREEAARAQEEELKGVKRKSPENAETESLDQNNAPSAKRPAVPSPGGKTSGLFC